MLATKNNPYRAKVALEQMKRDAAVETERLQLALDEKPTLEQARQQLAAEMRMRRKAELELDVAKNFRRIQPLPSTVKDKKQVAEENEREVLIARATIFLREQGYLVMPPSALEVYGFCKRSGDMKKAKRIEQQLEAEMAFDAGADYHQANPELILVEVLRYANRIYSQVHEVGAFYDGFMSARRVRDEYLREKRNAV